MDEGVREYMRMAWRPKYMRMAWRPTDTHVCDGAIRDRPGVVAKGTLRERGHSAATGAAAALEEPEEAPNSAGRGAGSLDGQERGRGRREDFWKDVTGRRGGTGCAAGRRGGERVEVHHQSVTAKVIELQVFLRCS